MGLKDDLRARIATSGPLPFDEFMAACLYDPAHGFFATGPLRSVRAGDFLTSPEVSPDFGRALGRFAGTERRRCAGSPFVVADLGAGSGSLLEPMLQTLGETPDDVYAVEASPAARRALTDRLGGVKVTAHLDDLPKHICGVVVANELLDNLPVRLAVWTGEAWEERGVGHHGGELTLVPIPASDDTRDWAERFAGRVPPGGMVEVQLEASAFVSAVVQRLDCGSFLAVDYGGTAEELEPRRTRGTLRTYRAHHLGPDPLLEPGATDITVDVNFTAMRASAEAAGARVEVVRQDDFLAGLGLREEIAGLRRRELEAARDRTRTMERLALRSRRVDAETLLHPRGLGDFRVLVARVP